MLRCGRLPPLLLLQRLWPDLRLLHLLLLLHVLLAPPLPLLFLLLLLQLQRVRHVPVRILLRGGGEVWRHGGHACAAGGALQDRG